jgi:hypothetical protein
MYVLQGNGGRRGWWILGVTTAVLVLLALLRGLSG